MTDHSRPGALASGPPSDLEAIARQACQLAGLVPRTIRLLRHFATAVFLVELDEGAVVVRVAYGPDCLVRSRKAVTMTRWLVGLGFPAIEPLDLPSQSEQPLAWPAEQEVAISFWHYYPPASGHAPAGEDVATIARRLHALTVPPPMPLPTYEPLRSVRRAVASASPRRLATAIANGWRGASRICANAMTSWRSRSASA